MCRRVMGWAQLFGAFVHFLKRAIFQTTTGCCCCFLKQPSPIANFLEICRHKNEIKASISDARQRGRSEHTSFPIFRRFWGVPESFGPPVPRKPHAADPKKKSIVTKELLAKLKKMNNSELARVLGVSWITHLQR